jgi:transcriptional regulator with XRE-family HTH domain
VQVFRLTLSGAVPQCRAMKLSAWLAQTETRPAHLAKTLGVAHSTVSRWLDGDTIPSMEMMRRVADATDGAVMANDWMAP